MGKFFLRFFLLILIILVSTVIFLSYFGIETDRFDNFIKNKANTINRYVKLNFNKTKIHLNVRELNLLLKLQDPKILAKGNEIDLNKLVSEFDLLIGGVLIPGAEAPKLVKKKMINNMKRGSVVVDVAIDQGGCIETSKPTTHANPTYIVDDVVHYCVANMPGGVPRTSTIALNKATLPFLNKLATNGYQKALKEDKNFLEGLNVHKGHVTYKAVADAFGHSFVSSAEAIK